MMHVYTLQFALCVLFNLAFCYKNNLKPSFCFLYVTMALIVYIQPIVIVLKFATISYYQKNIKATSRYDFIIVALFKVCLKCALRIQLSTGQKYFQVRWNVKHNFI